MGFATTSGIVEAPLGRLQGSRLFGQFELRYLILVIRGNIEEKRGAPFSELQYYVE